MKLRNYLATVCWLVLGLVFIVSCSDSSSNSVPPENDTPELPPVNSMTVDLSIFSTGQVDSSNIENYANYLHADTTIGAIASIQDRNIDIVRSLLENADTADAVKLEGGGWEWTYSNEDSSNNIELNSAVRLVAHWQNGDKIKWDVFFIQMSQSKRRSQNTSPVQGNHIISGTTNKEVTQGEWTYYGFGRAGQPQQKEVAELDWEIDENQNIDMELTLLASNFSGSVMEYYTEAAVRTIVLAPTESDKTTIKFNTETKAGFIDSPNYNGGEKACWNSDLKDVACTEISL